MYRDTNMGAVKYPLMLFFYLQKSQQNHFKFNKKLPTSFDDIIGKMFAPFKR